MQSVGFSSTEQISNHINCVQLIRNQFDCIDCKSHLFNYNQPNRFQITSVQLKAAHLQATAQIANLMLATKLLVWHKELLENHGGNMIVLFGTEKGGVGKTTVSTNIAAMLAIAGRDVLLIDTDHQGSAQD